uniref:Chalcone/stilbene synthase N-terminal domain-containing protein n=1 Tax=Oryza glumipatula TaxID=40148 RepID=A0A0E0A153_9ORYZ
MRSAYSANSFSDFGTNFSMGGFVLAAVAAVSFPGLTSSSSSHESFTAAKSSPASSRLPRHPKDAVPKLAMATAVRVIAKWGHPAADITHLVVSTNAGAHSLGTDEWLAALLGLRATVQRTILYMHGCSASCSALRLAKDIAENNHGARVLVACTEHTEHDSNISHVT